VQQNLCKLANIRTNVKHDYGRLVGKSISDVTDNPVLSAGSRTRALTHVQASYRDFMQRFKKWLQPSPA
jgi:hypothetical protein